MKRTQDTLEVCLKKEREQQKEKAQQQTGNKCKKIYITEKHKVLLELYVINGNHNSM